MHVNVQDETDESGKPRVNVVIAFSGTWGIDKKMSKEELIQFEGLVIETCMGRHSEFPRISRVRPIFVAAFAAAMLPGCTQSCDALSRGEQFSIATDLCADPASIYWRDWLFSKKHYPSSHTCSSIAIRQQTSSRSN